VATSTFGSTANNSLPFALQAPGSFISQLGTASSSIAAPADVAKVNQAILDDQNRNLPSPGAGPTWGWSTDGKLFIPNRGVLKVYPGDWVAVDTLGWPILVSAYSVANGTWVHNP
jgi:hypothetical protein